MDKDIEKQIRKIKTQKNIAITVLFSGIIFMFFAPHLITSFFYKNFNDTGQIGDTIGGILSPLVNLIGAVLVYLSFQQQIISNNIQLNLINKEIDKEKGRKQKEFLLISYNELKETLYNNEYKAYNEKEIKKGVMAFEYFGRDAREFGYFAHEFKSNIYNILKQLKNHLILVRNSKELTILEIEFFMDRTNSLYETFLKNTLSDFEVKEIMIAENETISFKKREIERLFERDYIKPINNNFTH